MTTITDEAIEEACDGFYTEPRGLTRWAKLVEVSPDIADRYRVAMSRALAAALPHVEAAIRADERAKTATGIAKMIRERADATLNRDERLAGLVDADYCRLYVERSQR